MAIYKGDKKVIALYKGDKPILKRYKGTELIYESKPNDETLSFEWSGTSTSQTFSINDTSYTASTNPYTTTLTNLGIEDFTSAKRMFYNSSGITAVTSIPDTSNVTQMSSVFRNCSGLTSLDVITTFDTSNVINMAYMFSNCSNLTTLDVSNFDTRNVTSMSYMFNGCSNLTSLDLSNFDTSNLTSIFSMFNGCSSLTSLDLSNWNVSKVPSFATMFKNCNSLTSLDLSNWNIKEGSTMVSMFDGCSSLSSLNLDGCVINSGTANSYTNMFNGCSGLTSISMYGCNCDTIKFIADRLIEATIVSSYAEASHIIQTDNTTCLDDGTIAAPEILEDCNTPINVLYVDENFASYNTPSNPVFDRYISFDENPCGNIGAIYIDAKGSGDDIIIKGTPYSYTTIENVGEYGDPYYKIPIKEMVGYPIYMTPDTADRVQRNALGIFYYQ